MTMIKEGNELIIAFRTAEKPKEIARAFDTFVNSFSVDIINFIENLKLEDDTVRNKFTLISFMWIKKLNYFKSKNWFDGRNAYSVTTAVNMNSLLGTALDELANGYDGTIDPEDYEHEQTEEGEKISFEIIFVEKMSRTHRTIQQTFSQIVFTWLSNLEGFETNENLVEVSSKINKNLDYMFYKTPLI